MPKLPILSTDEIVPPPAVIRAVLEAPKFSRDMSQHSALQRIKLTQFAWDESFSTNGDARASP
jgi:hypothetical protein